MSGFPQQAFLVSHTHWDREWYSTYHEFRVDLVRVMRRILGALERDPEFEHFVLDGQTVIVEDYLAVCPKDEDRIRRLVEAGRLSLGPWYVLPDEFLVSDEATVRNLLVGTRLAERLGGAQKVGYMPDSFGHIAQMPQILRQAGLDSFVYTRGNGDEIDDLGTEYLWRAPDGSEVLAINQCGGYCNAGGLGFEELWHAHTPREVDPDRAVEQIRELFTKMEPLSNGNIALVNNGCDHFPPQRDFGRILAALREAFPRTEFVHASLHDAVRAVRRATPVRKTFEGELRSGKLHAILSGVWSARMPLKQLNDRAQTLLAGYVEPLACAAHFLHGLEYPEGEIDAAWKTLLQNHPHDSICGCSTDEVHRENETRFAAVIQTAEQLLRRQMQDLVPTFAPTAAEDASTVLCVFNPLPFERTEVVERLIVLQPLGYDLDHLALVDESGQPVPFEIVDRWYVERFWGVDYRMMLWPREQLERFRRYREAFGPRILKTEAEKETADCFLHVRFLVEQLPAVGHRRYQLVDPGLLGANHLDPGPLGPRSRQGLVNDATGAAAAALSGVSVIDDSTLDNGLVAVTLHGDGSFDLVDRTTGHRNAGLCRLESTADIGDEYDYAPCEDSVTARPRREAGTLEFMTASSLQATMEARFDFALPSSVESDRRSRRSDSVPCPVVTRVTLRAGDPVVHVEMDFDNRVEDHRLRVEFPTGIASHEITSDGHFLVNHRPLDEPKGDDWVQPPSGTFPQQDFSWVSDEHRGLAVINHGLPEIAAHRDEDGRVTLGLTLLRCVGWLSRDDFATRRFTNAGPTLPTPGAQCPGRHRFQFAVMVFDGDPLERGALDHVQRTKRPPAVVQGVSAGSRPGAGLLRCESKKSRVTCVKKHTERNSLVVRSTNLSPVPTRSTWHLGRPVRSAYEVDLLEARPSRSAPAIEPSEARPVEGAAPVPEDVPTIVAGNVLELSQPPHRISTVEIDLDAPDPTTRSR